MHLRPSFGNSSFQARDTMKKPFVRARINNKETWLLAVIYINKINFRCIESKKSCRNIWWVCKKFVPLHPLNREAPCKAHKKEFFETLT